MKSNLQTIFTTLAHHNVRYVLIGGLGAVAHGARIPTSDVDICIATDGDNLRHIAEALAQLDASLVHQPEQKPDFANWQSLQLASPAIHHLFATPYGEIDVLPQPLGPQGEKTLFTYEQLAPRAVIKQAFGLSIHVAALDDIIASKLAAGRDKDRAALPELQRIKDDLARGMEYNGLTDE